eukprot:TRINITY_DN6524_c1_g1_i1.p1 TRINITY_DN6524_c1_g1~~TRINITY_DN6524_c1_g1_i1.p1  ORF type:complete len:286 (-),score=35.50 TRINITY_DN6524_c1_g1_i1:190-1047(-)
MALRFGVVHVIAIGSVAGLLLGVEAVRHDDPKSDSPPLSSFSGKRLTLDDCNALLYTIMTEGNDAQKLKTMLVIRDSLFQQNGLGILASFLSDGSFMIEVNQAWRTGGTNVGVSKLTVSKSSLGDKYKGVFLIGGHRLPWEAFNDGRFKWKRVKGSRHTIDLGRRGLSGSCFLIVGCAFIAEVLTPEHAGVAAKDGLTIFNSAAVLTGSASIDTDVAIAGMLTSMSMAQIQILFASKCGKVLRLSVGDVIAPIKSAPKPSGKSFLAESDENLTYDKTMQMTVHGV